MSIAFAMLRYRLWDIDLVVNRVIVSGLTTAGLGLLFVVGFFLTHVLLAAVMGIDQPYINLAVPAAIITLLFSPVQRRVRNCVDRSLYHFRFNLDELNEVQKQNQVSNPGLFTGQVFDQYTLEDVIGRGAMGEVYRARKNGETVAVKILSAHLAQRPEIRTRFEREAQTLQSLNHPHIVKLLDYGINAQIGYLIMEMIAGDDLQSCIRETGPLPLPEILSILQNVADALDYAHSQGFIHRDVKPSNVMLRREETPGADVINITVRSAVLMDFGLAKTDSLNSSITGNDAIGTIDYMSPEQITSAHEVGRQTDIYALGVMLYQMLTGEVPFKGSFAQVLFAHLQQPPPDPRTVRPDLPEPLTKAIAIALAKDPNERFQTAGQLVSFLNTSLN